MSSGVTGAGRSAREDAGSGLGGSDKDQRRRALYWVGFLDGAKTSRRVRVKEVEAVAHEAEAFQRFFRDSSARDIAHEIARPHLTGAQTPVDQVNDLVVAMRGPLYVDGALSLGDRVNEFLGFCAGIVSDGKVLEAEAVAIKRRFELDAELALDPQIAKIRQVVADALMDGRLDDDETRDIRAWIARLAGDGYAEAGLAGDGAAPHLPDMIVDHRLIAFENRIFVVTGALRLAPGYEVATLIGARGGELAARVTVETDFVVVAHDAARHRAPAEYGFEVKEARRLIDKGAGLRFVSEHGFEAALKSGGS